jgi:hypothetical protein
MLPEGAERKSCYPFSSFRGFGKEFTAVSQLTAAAKHLR